MRAAHGKSWMALDAKKHDLLYVADGRDKGVYVLTYPQGKVVGMLTTGLANPVGVCTDKLGNVWIANYDTGTMVEYAHGGSEPISSVQDPGTSPLDCSVDPTTGNLAVVAGPSMGSQTGSFLVYDRAAGTPHTYPVPFALPRTAVTITAETFSLMGSGITKCPDSCLVNCEGESRSLSRLQYNS